MFELLSALRNGFRKEGFILIRAEKEDQNRQKEMIKSGDKSEGEKIADKGKRGLDARRSEVVFLSALTRGLPAILSPATMSGRRWQTTIPLLLLLLILFSSPSLTTSSTTPNQPQARSQTRLIETSSTPSGSLISKLDSTLLRSLLRFLNFDAVSSSSSQYKSHSFTLKQAYHKGTHSYPNLTAKLGYHPHRPYSTYSDSATNPSRNFPPTFSQLRSRRQTVTRPRDPNAFLKARGDSYEKAQCAAQDALDWDDVEIDAPDVDHRPTLLALAKMASQAYDNDTSRWEPGFGGFNLVRDPIGRYCVEVEVEIESET